VSVVSEPFEADTRISSPIRTFEPTSASAFVCVATIGIIIATELLDGNPIFWDRERRSDHHHAAGLNDLIVHAPTIEPEHIIQALYNVDHSNC